MKQPAKVTQIQSYANKMATVYITLVSRVYSKQICKYRCL